MTQPISTPAAGPPESDQMVRALHESEARLRSVVDSAPIILYALDPQGIFTFSEGRGLQALGLASGELVGRSVFDVYRDVPQILDNCRRALAGEEFTAIVQVGDVTYESRYSPMRDCNGSPVGMIGVSTDVTDRIRTAADLEHSLSLLRSTLESTADGLLVVDGTGKIVSFNRRFAEMWAIPQEVLDSGDDGRAIQTVLSQLKDPDGFVAKVRELYAQPWAESYDVLEFEDGRTFERYSHPQTIGNQVVGRVWSFRDVSERRRAEEALRLSEAAYRELFESANDAIFVHDAETGAILDANQNACDLHGVTLEELRREGVARVSNAGEPYTPERAREYLRLAAAGEPQSFEWLVKSRGTETWAEVRLRRIVLNGEERVIAAVRNIDDRKRAEAALQTAYDELEERVRERTAELAETNMALEEEIAERQRAEDELLQRTSELEAVFQALPDIYFRLDADGAVLDCRCGQSADFLAGREDVLGRSVSELLPGEQGELIRDGVREVQRTGELVCVEFSLPVEGVDRDFEARLLPFLHGQVITVVRDVTTERKAERRLQRREEHFRRLIENAYDLIQVVDGTGRITYTGPSVLRLLGYTPEEIAGTDALSYLHPDDVPRAVEALSAFVQNPGVPASLEYRVRHKDGGWRVFEAYCRTLAPDSADQGIVVNARDITERHQAEEALRQSEEHYRLLIENSSDVATILDSSGVNVYQSPSIQRVLGYDPAELLGTSAFNRIHPDDLEITRGTLRGAVTSPGTTHTVEFRYRHKNGRWVTLEASARTLLPDSAAGGVVINSRDVTERKLSAEALERAKEDAERANRAKSEFLSRMSHELRTPMNSILGFAQLLAKRDLPADQRKPVDHILKAGRHLLTLINEVLDIARIEANRQPLSLEPVKARATIEEALSLIRPLAEQRGCTLEEVAGCEVHVRADGQRLTQVLLNLLSNAVKYNQRGGSVRLTCELREREDAPGSWLAIRVRDTGRGIPAERMDELFVPFSRLGAEQSDEEGTGLGLALSQRLVEAMAGRLLVESTVGVGSTFTIELPVVDSPLERLTRDSGARAPITSQADAQPATLLYIEDNLANLSLVETIFAARPEITLVPALQGRLGLDLAWEHAPDLILLDLHLPDIPGDEVLRRLRADERTRETPVIVISADAVTSRIERLRAAGAQEYLTKPLDIDLFIATVDRLLAAEESNR